MILRRSTAAQTSSDTPTATFHGTARYCGEFAGSTHCSTRSIAAAQPTKHPTTGTTDRVAHHNRTAVTALGMKKHSHGRSSHVSKTNTWQTG
jgi:hypothetical protein